MLEGKPFGRYRLLSLLGRGGMGEVWRAYDTGTDRQVAVKVLSTHLAQDQTFQERFRREARAAARLHSPHIVHIHDYGEIDGQLFVDMALIDGDDLASAIAAGPMIPERAVKIIQQVARALNTAHAIGLVHRDVKPSNILLDHDDHAYLIDFGIARAAADARLTGTGITVGTWAYMAPERFMSDEIHTAIDVYALACVLYECLTGTRPYPDEGLEHQFAGHLSSPPPQPSAIRRELPRAFDDVIATGMAKEPDHRYRTANDLAVAARGALNDTTPTSTQAPTQHSNSYAASVHPTVAAQRRSIAPADAPTAQANSGTVVGTAWPAGRKTALIGFAALVIIAGVLATMLTIGHDQTSNIGSPSAAKPVSYGAQVTLPLTGVALPGDVAVDALGNVYVTDYRTNRLVRMDHDTAGQTDIPLPGSGWDAPDGVATDTAGNIYVTVRAENRVLKFDADSNIQSELPFTGLDDPRGIALDSDGNVYVGDNIRVLKLDVATNTQTELPFAGLSTRPDIAVDGNGNVYATDRFNNRVLMLDAGGGAQTELRLNQVSRPGGVAADSVGNVYIADNVRVLQFNVETNSQTDLPFVGLDSPEGIAVDNSGNVYVADYNNDRVLKLSVESTT